MAKAYVDSRAYRAYHARLRSEESTCIADDSEYDEETGDMIIVFQKRGTFLYHNVSPDDAKALQGAGLKGSFFNLYFRPTYTDFERIG